ncbi:MAG: hypothetical protein K2J20_04925 [Bacilli bacterium]|nr:hypothetical protein [Bacilli bacterium]
MGLMNKLKNILFEEEEVEIPVIEKRAKQPEERVPVYKEMPRKEEVKEPNYNSFFDNAEPEVKKEPEKQVEYRHAEVAHSSDVVSERQLFSSEKTFNFPAFDEEEFESMTPKHRPTNVMEHEKKKVEKKPERKAPVKKVEDKTKFRPSPIISPVYGILDKNYTPDEITSREDAMTSRALDVDSVRKKAFGAMDEVKEPEIEIQEEKIDTEEKILEEKLEKARTIDELLNDSSDEIISVEDELDNVPEPIISDETEELEKTLNLEPVHEENLEDDTLESDLFDLIDSMYENREDGE